LQRTGEFDLIVWLTTMTERLGANAAPQHRGEATMRRPVTLMKEGSPAAAAQPANPELEECGQVHCKPL